MNPRRSRHNLQARKRRRDSWNPHRMAILLEEGYRLHQRLTACFESWYERQALAVAMVAEREGLG